VPVLSYFLIVGSVLTGLLFYADSVMVAGPLPFSTSQRIGLPEPYKAPVVVVEVPKPEIIAATVEAPVEAKKPVKAVREHKPTRVVRQHKPTRVVRQHKPTRVVRQSVPQERYAAYPKREYGSIW